MPAKETNYALASRPFNFLISWYRSLEHFSPLFFIFLPSTHPVSRQLKLRGSIFTADAFLLTFSLSLQEYVRNTRPAIAADRLVNQSGIVFPRTGEFSRLICRSDRAKFIPYQPVTARLITLFLAPR